MIDLPFPNPNMTKNERIDTEIVKVLESRPNDWMDSRAIKDALYDRLRGSTPSTITIGVRCRMLVAKRLIDRKLTSAYKPRSKFRARA